MARVLITSSTLKAVSETATVKLSATANTVGGVQPPGPGPIGRIGGLEGLIRRVADYPLGRQTAAVPY